MRNTENERPRQRGESGAYPAKCSYLDREVPANYEADRFSGLLGK
jgi:hypothetical protein